MRIWEDQAVFVKFLLLFTALNALGQLYPPEGGYLKQLLAFGALTLLAASLALPSKSENPSKTSQDGGARHEG